MIDSTTGSGRRALRSCGEVLQVAQVIQLREPGLGARLETAVANLALQFSDVDDFTVGILLGENPKVLNDWKERGLLKAGAGGLTTPLSVIAALSWGIEPGSKASSEAVESDAAEADPEAWGKLIQLWPRAAK